LAAALALALIVALLFVGSYAWGWDWTGLAPAFSPAKKGRDYFAGKTLWDWLQLLFVPAVVAGGVAWLGANTARRQALEAELRNQRTAFELAEESQQDQVLATYLDRMSTLLLDGDRRLRESEPGSEVRTVARAWTLSTLARLDGGRKRHVVFFLYESDLLTGEKPVVSLVAADLREADLRGAFLLGANLSRADLREATLDGANLVKANLGGADLTGATLREVRDEADLVMVDLREAILARAYLDEADLTGAYVTDQQLKSTFRCEKAAMPDGRTFEGWDSGSYETEGITQLLPP
jgi:hypothetical protein